LFATSINNTSGTGGKFVAGDVDTGGKYAACVTSNNFAAGVVDTGGAL
jgi:hypothetical protein